MNDLAYNDCNYRFKGKSCEDCKLDCIYKNKNNLYRKYKAQEQQLNKLASKLDKIKEYANHLEVFVHIKEDLLNIIEGVEE